MTFLHKNQNSAQMLLGSIDQHSEDLVSATRKLIAIQSPSPPGDTREIAAAVENVIEAWIPCAKLQPRDDFYKPSLDDKPPAPAPKSNSNTNKRDLIRNVVAVIQSGKTGRRLILNGHMDTFPAAAADEMPEHEGRIYGRGAADMKGGIVAALMAARVLAQRKDLWSGELVLTFVGDEESMGGQGTAKILKNIPEVRGDACICADAGSPSVIRFGEKGLCWLDVYAEGQSAHGAHVHKGISALERLLEALAVIKDLENLTVNAPAEVSKAIEAASGISEAISGAGESNVLQRVTVNVGTMRSGTVRNLIPNEAMATVDIRLPIGVSLSQIKTHLDKQLGTLKGVRWEIWNGAGSGGQNEDDEAPYERAFEPSYTSPSHPIVRMALAASEHVTGKSAVANMRVGASDTRLFRSGGIPSVVVGLTPHGMGGAHEFCEVEELEQLTKIIALMALEYLQ